MIDTHAHIDDPQYQADFGRFVSEQQAGGVEAICVPSIDAASCQSVLQVCEQYPHYLFPALGLHPEEVKDDWQEQLAAIRRTLSVVKCRCIAIGEIGLDYYWDTTYREQQVQAFRQQLEWAIEMDLPVMIHCRNAMDECLPLLREFTKKGLRGVMHCFSGSRETAAELVKLGMYLGVGGVITFKNCRLKEHLSSIPLDRLLLETDSPYMAPVPHRGERNESRWMSFVMDELSHTYQVPVDEIERITTASAKTLFKI